MPKFTTRDGKTVQSNDPARAIWYGQCGFWTDDWSVPVLVGPGIPACPKCNNVGFICTAGDWDKGAMDLDAKEPGYLKFLNAHKAKCLRDVPGGLLALWNAQKTDPKNLKIIPDGFQLPDGGTDADNARLNGPKRSA